MSVWWCTTALFVHVTSLLDINYQQETNAFCYLLILPIPSVKVHREISNFTSQPTRDGDEILSSHVNSNLFVGAFGFEMWDNYSPKGGASEHNLCPPTECLKSAIFSVEFGGAKLKQHVELWTTRCSRTQVLSIPNNGGLNLIWIEKMKWPAGHINTGGIYKI